MTSFKGCHPYSIVPGFSRHDQRLVRQSKAHSSLKISCPSLSAKTQWRPVMSLRGEGTRQPRETHEKKSASTLARHPASEFNRRQQRKQRIESGSVYSVASCSNHSASLAAERKGQRREPAADDVRFVSERIGWLPFAAPSGSVMFCTICRRLYLSCRRRRSRLSDSFCLSTRVIWRSISSIHPCASFCRRGSQSRASCATLASNSRQPLSSFFFGIRHRHSSSHRVPPQCEQRRPHSKP